VRTQVPGRARRDDLERAAWEAAVADGVAAGLVGCGGQDTGDRRRRVEDRLQVETM